MSWKIALGTALLLAGAVTLGAIAGHDSESGTATWDSARAAGFTAYLLIWASILLGLTIHLRIRLLPVRQSHLLEAHRGASALSASFLLAHVLALCLDPVVDFSPQTVVMPLTSEYRPVQVALGSVALLLLAVVLASTALASRFSYHAWHRIHLLSFPAFTLALTHGLTAGTDTAHPFATAIYAATAASTVMLLVLRVAGPAWVGSSEPIRP